MDPAVGLLRVFLLMCHGNLCIYGTRYLASIEHVLAMCIPRVYKMQCSAI